MCTDFKTETDITQNLIDNFFPKNFPLEGFKNMWVRG